MALSLCVCRNFLAERRQCWAAWATRFPAHRDVSPGRVQAQCLAWRWVLAVWSGWRWPASRGFSALSSNLL